MAVSIVQSKKVGTYQATFDAPPTPGNKIFALTNNQQSAVSIPMDTGGLTKIGSTLHAQVSGYGGNAQFAYRDVQTGDPAGPYGNSIVASNNETTIIEVSGLAPGAPLDTSSIDDQVGTAISRSITPTGGVPAWLVGGFASYLYGAFGGTPVFTPNGVTTDVDPLKVHTGMWGHGQIVYGETAGTAVTIGGTQSGTTNGSYRWGMIVAAFAVEAGGGSVQANFTGTPTSGVATLSVTFTDTSAGTPTAWSWNFGDGSPAGTAQNPSHDYTTPGVYTVSLTASNAGGTATLTRTDYIRVSSPGVVIGDELLTLPVEDIQSWDIRRASGGAFMGSSYTGSATLRLINRDNRYNPENESSDIIDSLRDGTRIWIGVNEDGTVAADDTKDVYGLFAGRITEITVIPTPGTDTPAYVEFVCEDPLSWIERAPVRLLASRHRSQQDLRSEVLAAAGETSTDLDEEAMTMPLSYVDGDAGGILEELNKASGTRHFARPADDPDSWYTYATLARMGNLAGAAQGTVSAGTQHVTSTSGWRTSADTVINQQQATIEPYFFSSTSTVVWQYEDVPFPASRRTEIWVDFDDFVDSPVVDLAYTGGTVTASFTDFGTTGKIELNVSGTATINRLEVEGSLARRGPAESIIIDDEDSQEPPRGVRAGNEISGDYVGTITAAKGVSEHVVWRYADPKYRPDLTIENWFPNQFALDLYDNIAVTSTHIGVAARIFEIVGLTHEGIRAADSGVVHHKVTYELMESRVQTTTNWFTCNVSTAAGGTHILGY